eukprot:4275785-Pleurochrysis_carterae.AAC.4
MPQSRFVKGRVKHLIGCSSCWTDLRQSKVLGERHALSLKLLYFFENAKWLCNVLQGQFRCSGWNISTHLAMYKRVYFPPSPSLTCNLSFRDLRQAH